MTKQSNNAPEALTFSQKWTKALQSFTRPLLQPILAMSHHAATHPKLYIVGTIVFSIGILFLGIVTNFEQETDDDIWTPAGSKSVEHGSWIEDNSNFPKDTRDAVIIVHRNGQNLFGDSDGSMALESAQRMFEALDEFRQTPRYEELCALSSYVHPVTQKNTCQIIGASTYWNDTTAIFNEQATSNQVVLETMSAATFPYGGMVHHDTILGFNQFDEQGVLNYAESYFMVISLPPDDTEGSFAEDFEDQALDRLLNLRDQWQGSGFVVEILAERSFEDEFTRAVTKDLPLIPLVFVLMSILCIIIYARKDKVLSRSWLGFGAVATVLCAIMASFGLLFVIGVPFTSLTPVSGDDVGLLDQGTLRLAHAFPLLTTAPTLYHVWSRPR